MAQPTMYLIAGPNGAGKSTLYEKVIKPKIKAPFLNADIVQRDELQNPSMDASYEAAAIVRERIKENFATGKSFVTETVFSHESKLKLIDSAQSAGHRVVLYHVGVRNADISVKRVGSRVQRGGHPVPEDKIRSRFERNQPLIAEAAKKADRAFVYDNSVLGRDPQLGIKFRLGKIVEIGEKLPKWMREFYSQELKPYSLTRQNPAAASYSFVNNMAKTLSGNELEAAKITEKGEIYHGPIVGESAMHYLQEVQGLGYVAHFKSVLDRQPRHGEPVSIKYATKRRATVEPLMQLEKKNLKEGQKNMNDISGLGSQRKITDFVDPSKKIKRGAINNSDSLKEEYSEDILASFEAVRNGTQPIQSLRATIGRVYQSSIDNNVNDFAFYGANASTALGAAATLNAGLTSELMTAQAAVDKINQVKPALRADKPKEITSEQMQDLKTSSQNNVYGEAFLASAARISPTFMRFYTQSQSLITMLVPSVSTKERLLDEQIDASLIEDAKLKNGAKELRDKISTIYEKPDQAYEKALGMVKDPNISPSALRDTIEQKPEILGQIKPVKKGMFSKVDERATHSALYEVEEAAKDLSSSLQHGREKARKIESDVSKTLGQGIELPSAELNEGLQKFALNPDLKNFGKGYDVDKLYTQGQIFLEKTGEITRLAGKNGFGIKPEALENIKRLKSTVQKLEQTKLVLKKTLTPKLGPKL